MGGAFGGGPEDGKSTAEGSEESRRQAANVSDKSARSCKARQDFENVRRT